MEPPPTTGSEVNPDHWFEAQTIDEILDAIKAERPETAKTLGEQWTKLATEHLAPTIRRIRQATGLERSWNTGGGQATYQESISDNQEWSSPEAKGVFEERVAETILYIDDTSNAVLRIGQGLNGLAAVMEDGRDRMQDLYNEYRRTMTAWDEARELDIEAHKNTAGLNAHKNVRAVEEASRVGLANENVFAGGDFRERFRRAWDKEARELAREIEQTYQEPLRKLETMLPEREAGDFRLHPGAMGGDLPPMPPAAPPPAAGGGAPPAPAAPPPPVPTTGAAPAAPAPPTPTVASPGTTAVSSPPVPVAPAVAAPAPPAAPAVVAPPVPPVGLGAQPAGAGTPGTQVGPVVAPPTHRPFAAPPGTSGHGLSNGVLSAPAGQPQPSAPPPGGSSFDPTNPVPPGTAGPSAPADPSVPGSPATPEAPGGGGGEAPPGTSAHAPPATGGAPPGAGMPPGMAPPTPPQNNQQDRQQPSPPGQGTPVTSPPSAFRPPAAGAGKPVLGDPQQRRGRPGGPAEAVRPRAEGSSPPPSGGTPPVLANRYRTGPRLTHTEERAAEREAGRERMKRLREVLKSSLAKGLPASTAPVLDSPATTGSRPEDAPVALSNPRREVAPDPHTRPVTPADRVARRPVVEQPAAATEQPGADDSTQNAWRVESPGGPVLSGDHQADAAPTDNGRRGLAT